MKSWIFRPSHERNRITFPEELDFGSFRAKECYSIGR
jgi:hypothetical protein